MKKFYPVLVLIACCVVSCHSGDENDSSELDARREAKCYDSGGDYYKGICYCDDIACPKGRYCDQETGQCEIKQSAEEQKLEAACVESGGSFQDGFCICSNVPCEDKHVCDPDTLECAKTNVPVEPEPEPVPPNPPAPKDCISSGGTLMSGMCFCNGNLCDPGIFCNEIGICSNREAKIEASCTESGGVYQDGYCVCSEVVCNAGIYCNEAGKCSNLPPDIVISEECQNDNNDYWCKDGEVLHCGADYSGNISARTVVTCGYGCSTQEILKPDDNHQYTELDAKKILCRECEESLNSCEGDAIYTCKAGKRIETKCLLNDKPVSCKNNKECGKCMNDDYDCYNVTLNNGVSDVEIGIKTMCIKGEWHEVNKSELKNDNPKLSSLLDQFSCNYNSCRKDGKCGVCVNGSHSCSNDSNGVGKLRECVDGAWNEIDSCGNTSCSVSVCGECLNDAVKECEQYCTDGSEQCDNPKKAYRKGVCQSGKWVYSECSI
ncbi:MAG: hypothetical protein IJU23_07355 [Proteobacteria bacterium]|nr:hypothetical protein [Pseudomonadota bacterium]